MNLRLAIVEDDANYRASLKALFEVQPGFAHAETFVASSPLLLAAEAAGAGEPARWDLVLMDLQLPDMSGIEATRRLKQLAPGVAVVALTVFEEPATILEAICAGVDGYLLKTTPVGELIAQIRVIATGGSPLTPGVARSLLEIMRRMGDGRAPGPPEAPTRLDLSVREQEVLRWLVRGHSYKQVADEMKISLDTVRTHVRHIYRKLQVHSVAQAINRAIHEGLV